MKIKDENLLLIFAITLMAVMGVASISPALPLIQEKFDISTTQTGLLVTFFTLPGIFLTPVLGVLADRYGRKLILVPSLLLFGLAGFACAIAPGFFWLLVFRLIQGIGGAALGSLNVTLIGDLYPERRHQIMGYNATVLSVATAIYPSIGGALAGIDWQWVFYLPLLAVPVSIIVLLRLNNPEPKNRQKLKDYFTDTWKLIKTRQVLALMILNIITFIILYGVMITYFPFFLKSKFGVTALVIGFVMSGFSFSTAITSFQLGNLNRRIGSRNLLMMASVLYTIVLLIVPFISSLLLMVIPVLLYGVAQGINFPNIQARLAGLAPIENRAAFLSLNGMILRLGQTLGPVIMGVFYGWFGVESVFWAGAVMSVLLLPIVWYNL